MQHAEARGASGATDRCRIVFGVDERYVDPLLVAITSLVADGGVGRSTPITVIHCELGPDAQARIRRVAAALDLDVDIVALAPQPQRFPLSGWITPAAYLRLRLGEAGLDASHAVYLDCDLIAVGDVTEIISTKPTETVAAAADLSHPLVRCGEGLPGYEQLGIDGSREYLNSGVLVIDLDRWERADTAARCTRFLVEHPEHVAFWDQDALNYVLDDGWQRLAPRLQHDRAVPDARHDRRARSRPSAAHGRSRRAQEADVRDPALRRSTEAVEPVVP